MVSAPYLIYLLAVSLLLIYLPTLFTVIYSCSIRFGCRTFCFFCVRC